MTDRKESNSDLITPTLRVSEPAQLILRSIGEGDVRQATECGLLAWQSSIGRYLGDFGPSQWIDLENAFALYLASFVNPKTDNGRNERLVIAECDGTIAGFCGYEMNEAYLSDLWVAPQWQGRAVGAQLLKAAQLALRLSGQKMMALEVLAQNARAIAFYQKHGLVETARSVKYDPVLKRKLLKIWMQMEL
ncbi:GNAT family N-acetyltransferase [uncultured Cohaesibacter sp.]|uniref:GNAT family N-acetyltransferase n=1 Tax=uncultured Cohaesibacter sp. TaxID=1002546 RepID=UPI0029C85738|nr:GNAT family N-acetyltransferase [uncultured Cohaesibacter sp.]